MRVIAGRLGGRTFQTPNGNRTHPMSDKMRGALFNILGIIEGQTVLDAFAGSGALSFEAASRGASQVIALERDRAAQTAIADSISELDIQTSVKLTRAAAGAWLRTSSDRFDIILLDPPYDALQPNLLNELAARLQPGGQLALSWPGKQAPPQFADLQLRTAKRYGDGSLYVYERFGVANAAA